MASVGKKGPTSTRSLTSTEADPQPTKPKPAANGTGARPTSNQVSPYVDSNLTQILSLQKKKNQLPPMRRSLEETRTKRSAAMLQGKTGDSGITPVDQSGDSSAVKLGRKGTAELKPIGSGDAATKALTKGQPKKISVKPRQAKTKTTSQTGSDVTSKPEVDSKSSPGKSGARKKRKTSDRTENKEWEQVTDPGRTAPTSIRRNSIGAQNRSRKDSLESRSDSEANRAKSEIYEEVEEDLSGSNEDETKEVDKSVEKPTELVHPEAVDESLTEDGEALPSDDETPDVHGEQTTTTTAASLSRLTEERLEGDGADTAAGEESESGGESDAEMSSRLDEKSRNIGRGDDSSRESHFPRQTMKAGEFEAGDSEEDQADNALSQIAEEDHNGGEWRSERGADTARTNNEEVNQLDSNEQPNGNLNDTDGAPNGQLEEPGVVDGNTTGMLESPDDGKTESPEGGADRRLESVNISSNNNSNNHVSDSFSNNSDESPSVSIQPSKRKRGSTSASVGNNRTRQEMQSVLRKRDTLGRLEVRSSSEDSRSPARSGGQAVQKPEAGSVLSKNSAVPAGPSRLLTLSRRGEWSVVDQLIRAMERGNEEINYADEVSTD